MTSGSYIICVSFSSLPANKVMPISEGCSEENEITMHADIQHGGWMSYTAGFVRVPLFSLSSRYIEKEEKRIGRLWCNLFFIIIVFILGLVSFIIGGKREIQLRLSTR